MEVKMTSELQGKLEGLLPMTAGETIEYVPDVFKTLGLTDEEVEFCAPKIHLRPWTNKEVIKVRKQERKEQQAEESGKDINFDRRQILTSLIKPAIVKIENIRHYKTLEPMENTIDNLSEPILLNIYDKLSDISGLNNAMIARIKQVVKQKEMLGNI